MFGLLQGRQRHERENIKAGGYVRNHHQGHGNGKDVQGTGASRGEVRNLAAKSSEAAKTTGALIDSSLDIVENGVQIADETAMSLQNVKEGAGEVADALAEITKASSEQADSVAHITRAISQISNVTQGNSATAEESAAASEELSAQAVLLEELIAKFKM